MKVQLNTNYAQRNVPQKTNKAQAFKSPNFEGTVQVAVQLGDSLSERLLGQIVKKFQPFKHTLIESIDEKEGYRFVKASFAPQQDAMVLRTLAGLSESGDNKFVLDYTSAQHSLNPEELALMKFEQTFEHKPSANPQDISQIRRNVIIED